MNLSPNELVLVAALILLALCGNVIGFPFVPALGFTLALGLIFYLIQTGTKQKKSEEESI
jgi:hypothetical protein